MTIHDESTLDLFRGPGRCDLCGALHSNRHPHHWRCKGMDGGSRLDVRFNLAACCPVPCHLKAHQGKLESEFVLGKIAKREGTTPDAIREAINWILRLDKDATPWRVAEAMGELTEAARALVQSVVAAKMSA